MIITILAFIFVFAVIVLSHEAGHFLAAKKFGVKVEEFAFGFPPKLWSKKKGETTYAINAIPIGGYVKLLGEDGTKNKNPENLNNKKSWQRVTIFGAGVFANFILAWILLTSFYLIGGQAIIDGMWEHESVENNQRVVITDVEETSPAKEAGIAPGDIILNINGKGVYNNNAVFAEIQRAKTTESSVLATIVSDGEARDVELQTYTDTIEVDGESIKAERVGVVLETTGKIKAKWYAAPLVAAAETYRITGLAITGIWDFISQLFTTFSISEDVGGPVAIAQLTGAAAELGTGALLQTIIILSIVLGVFNILPFPALDGGHIMMIAIEKLTRREIPVRVKNLVNLAGFGLLLLLVLLVTFKDVGRLNIF